MASQSWRLHPAVRLHWRVFGTEAVVFDEYSGATHLIDPLAAGVLGCLEDGAVWTVQQLLDDLGADLDPAALADAAGRLVPIGLVQAATAPSTHTTAPAADAAA